MKTSDKSKRHKELTMRVVTKKTIEHTDRVQLKSIQAMFKKTFRGKGARKSLNLSSNPIFLRRCPGTLRGSAAL